jgi:exopolysaccharide biosynthesis polyprenyl glycosylphosphotransferase
MSTSTIVDRSEEILGPHDAERSPAQPLRSFSSPHSEPRKEKRVFRIARLGDTAIALVALIGGFLAGSVNRMPAGWQAFLGMRLTVKNLLLVLGYLIAWRLICVLFGLYDEKRTRSRWTESLRVLGAATVAAAVALIFPFISTTHAFSHYAVLYFWIGSTSSMLLLRSGLRTVLRAPSPRTQDILIVGSGPRALTLYYRLFSARTNGRRLVGFVDSVDGEERELAPDIRSRLLGNLASLEQILMRHAVDEVLIALPVRSQYAEIERAIEICERGGVTTRYLADVFSSRANGKQNHVEPITAVAAHVSPDDDRLVVKRWMDIVLASLALLVLLPLFAVAGLAIKLTSPGPIFFAQERCGLNKRRFKMYKLRTMVLDAEAQQGLLEAWNEASGPVFKIRADPRVTPVGRVLRRFSIDELPQLINVLRGEMSLVGPRPLPLRDVGLFSEPWLMRRFSARPGLTCLWQISGRSDLSFERWIELDLEYIDRWSLMLDATILLRSIPAVLRARGAV